MKVLHAVVLSGALLAAAGTVAAGQDEFQRMQTWRMMDKKRAAEAERLAEVERQKEVQAGEAAPLPKDKTPETPAPKLVRPPGAHP